MQQTSLPQCKWLLSMARVCGGRFCLAREQQCRARYTWRSPALTRVQLDQSYLAD